jgi:hypothetical protein
MADSENEEPTTRGRGKWRIGARLGERIQCYEQPDEIVDAH